MKLLSDNDSELPRKKILQMLGLKEANGTRVLKTLEAEKLIRREKRGRDVTVKLTSEGRRSLWLWDTPNVSEQPTLTTDVIDGVSSTEWNASSSAEEFSDLAA